MPAMSLAHGKILVHLKDRRRLVVDADDVYYLEAQRDETDVRLRGARRLLDVRSLGEVMKDLGPAGFVRIHRNHAVNPGRVREIRLVGRAWQVQLEPPVNKVLPVSRGSLAALLETYRRSGSGRR
jgi:DNA-binding LytR/AlgR family response regulator